MTRPYDSTSKFLIEGFPADWLALAGLDVLGPVEVIDANLSTITAEADKVIRVGGAAPWLAHFEMQSARDVRLGARLLRYNVLLNERHDLPTRSVVVLLRPEADGPDLSGTYRRNLPGGPDYLVFDYNVLRVWREPVDLFLDGGLGIIPLAPVADLAGRPIENVVEAMEARLDQSPPEVSSLLWTASALLMGLRYPAPMIQVLLRGVRQMKESTMYQAILAEGEARGEARGEAKGKALGEAIGIMQGEILHARRSLIRQGERRFGPIEEPDRTRIEQIVQLDRLESLLDRVGDVQAISWTEFWNQVEPDGTRE